MEYRDNREFSRSHNDGQRMSKAAKRRRRRRRKILQAVIPVAVAVILIVVILIVGIKTGLFDSFTYSSSKADLNSYFRCTGLNEATIIRDGEITDERMTVRDGHLYVDSEIVDDNYNDNFYYEAAQNSLLYTTGKGIYMAKADNTGYSLAGNVTPTDYVVCYMNGEKLMICLDYVKLFTNMEIRLFGGGKEPYRAEIRTQWGSDVVADITKDEVAIRIQADKQSDILEEMSEGDKVVVVASENEDWMKVTTADLITGFIEKKYLSDSYEMAQTPVNDVEPISVASVADYSKAVVLAWHNVTTVDAAKYLDDYIKYLDNINTISPTWFALSDNEGTVESIASENYVSKCHDKGIKVWGVVDNITYPDVSSYTVLSDPDKRAHVIEQVISLSLQYNLDGINVDFEQLSQDAGPAFVQFVRELSLKAHEQNLVVSVDNYVPQGYTMHYNRKEQGVFADYVIIMGYDEHTSGSEEPGSVASIDFVLNGIEQTLAEVPANKVINAVPFYTRYWSVDSNGAINDMQTLPMATGLETVRKSGVEATWDELTNQNYAQWQESGNTKMIWLEDADSLRSKMEVMKTQGVNGVAVWQLAYSTDSAWEVINEYFTP